MKLVILSPWNPSVHERLQCFRVGGIEHKTEERSCEARGRLGLQGVPPKGLLDFETRGSDSKLLIGITDARSFALFLTEVNICLNMLAAKGRSSSAEGASKNSNSSSDERKISESLAPATARQDGAQHLTHVKELVYY